MFKVFRVRSLITSTHKITVWFQNIHIYSKIRQKLRFHASTSTFNAATGQTKGQTESLTLANTFPQQIEVASLLQASYNLRLPL